MVNKINLNLSHSLVKLTGKDRIDRKKVKKCLLECNYAYNT